MWFLENILTHQNSRLTCIDNFSKGDTHKVFMENITTQLDKIFLYYEDSASALKKLPISEYDVVYIDGDHTPFGVLRDAVMAWELLKDDGIIIFDDYLLKDKFSNPKPGIDAFLSVVKHKLLYKDYQIIIKKGV